MASKVMCYVVVYTKTQHTKHDMHVSLFHKEKWCLDKKVIYITLAIEMNENGVCTILYLQWLSHLLN